MGLVLGSHLHDMGHYDTEFLDSFEEMILVPKKPGKSK